MAQLRAAVESDAGTIRKLVLGAGLDPTSLNWVHFWIAEEDGQIVGVGQVKRLPGANELGSLVVVPAYRGRGIAAQLIRALEAQAGLPLYLLCRDTLEPYYVRYGFRRIGFGEAPAILKLKLVAAAVMRPFGIRVLVMVKD